MGKSDLLSPCLNPPIASASSVWSHHLSWQKPTSYTEVRKDEDAHPPRKVFGMEARLGIVQKKKSEYTLSKDSTSDRSSGDESNWSEYGSCELVERLQQRSGRRWEWKSYQRWLRADSLLTGLVGIGSRCRVQIPDVVITSCNRCASSLSRRQVQYNKTDYYFPSETQCAPFVVWAAESKQN